jgi:hypothetical protein
MEKKMIKKSPHKANDHDQQEEMQCENYRYPLPKDVIKDMINISQISNLSLLFQRFVPYKLNEWCVDNDIWIHKPGKEKKQKHPKIEEKGNQLVCDDIIKNFLLRQQALRQSLKKRVKEYQCTDFQAKTITELSIGFGNITPLETGLTIHKFYNLPYIPATSIKGICRSWVLNHLMDKLNLPVLSNEQIKTIHDDKKAQTPYEKLETCLMDPNNNDKSGEDFGN